MIARLHMSIKSILLATFFMICGTFYSSAQDPTSHESAEATTSEEHGEGKLDIKGEIFGHINDSYDWHLFNIGEGHEATHVSVPLPVIIFHDGLHVFMSSKFHHGEEVVEDNGTFFKLVGGKIYLTDASGTVTMNEKGVPTNERPVFDISITKNVLCLFISVIILWFLMTGVARKYKKNGIHVAPSGFQNAIEPIIGFIQDTVAKPFLGKQYAKFMPLLLTLFFFIWINNMLGLLPFGFNLTGNIAVTLLLALVFYVVMLFNSNKYFWGHIFNPPGVPGWVKVILVPIEILSNLVIKPAALAIRLFANIFAGHTIVISIILLIFIFAGLSKVAGIAFIPVSVGFTIFMYFLELLVAAIQAFIFTNLTAVFIGQAIEEHHHDEAHGNDHH